MGRRGNGPAQPFRNKLPIALLVVFALLAFAGPALFFRTANTKPMTVAEYEATQAGRPAHVAGKVMEVGDERFRFEALEGPAEALKLTGTVLEARGGNYRVELGKREDIRPGAVVVVGGRKRDDRTIEPGVVLILTDRVPIPQ